MITFDLTAEVIDPLPPGSHVLLLSSCPDDGLLGRRLGLELRDTLLVMDVDGVRLAFLFRKDLTGTVAESMLTHGTGALNIDGTRIGTSKRVPSTCYKGGQFPSGGWKRDVEADTPDNPSRSGMDPNIGRWPTNFVLLHSLGCEPAGTRQVRGSNASGKGMVSRGWFGDGGWKPMPGAANRRHQELAPDGTEEVAAWDCLVCCPVMALDHQSMEAGIHSAGASRTGSATPRETEPTVWQGPATTSTGTMHRFGDEGGASRFFPQFANNEALIDWLQTLIGDAP